MSEQNYQIIFATGNANKVREVCQILEGTGYEIVSMKDAGIDVEIIEDGKTFEENAIIKAKTIAEASGELVLADDSGLEIDYLNGEPGIYSARYMGEDTSYDIKNANLMERLEGVPDEKRTARFVCAIAAVWPDGKVKTAVCTMEGRIAYESAGANGFGYDPIFKPDGYDKTFAELGMDIKNHISHRARATAKLADFLLKK